MVGGERWSKVDSKVDGYICQEGHVGMDDVEILSLWCSAKAESIMLTISLNSRDGDS